MSRPGEGEAHARIPFGEVLILAAVGVVASVGVGVSLATVTSTVLSDTHPAGGSANEVRLGVVRNQFVPSADQPTFSSGWHTHPGPVIFQAQEGYLKITQATCHANVIGPGETYIETAELPVVATANQEASWTATLIVPSGVPLRTNSSDPC